MANFWTIVNRTIHNADFLLEIVDARNIAATRNHEIEGKIRNMGKLLIYVVNKADLVDKKLLQKEIQSLRPAVFVSTKAHFGVGKLRERILIEAKKKKISDPKVGVLGYPNVGKSSVINALKGRKSAKTSGESGYTKGVQFVRAGNMLLLDTPGVYPASADKLKQIQLGVVDYAKVKQPDLVVMELMEEYAGKIENHFGVPMDEDFEESLEKIASNTGCIKKGGKPDLEKVSRMILRVWQEGKIGN